MHFRCMRYVILLLLAFTFACEKDDTSPERLVNIEDKILSDDITATYVINYASDKVQSVDTYKAGTFRYTVDEPRGSDVNYLRLDPASLIGLTIEEIQETLDPTIYDQENEVTVVSGRLEKIEALDNVITFQYE